MNKFEFVECVVRPGSCCWVGQVRTPGEEPFRNMFDSAVGVALWFNEVLGTDEAERACEAVRVVESKVIPF